MEHDYMRPHIHLRRKYNLSAFSPCLKIASSYPNTSLVMAMAKCFFHLCAHSPKMGHVSTNVYFSSYSFCITRATDLKIIQRIQNNQHILGTGLASCLPLSMRWPHNFFNKKLALNPLSKLVSEMHCEHLNRSDPHIYKICAGSFLT